MHCTLLVPDLFWPSDTAAEANRGLALETLEIALARARAEKHPPIVREGWLCQAFEVERQQDWPVAPLTLPLDGGEPEDAYWLRVDPVHLQMQRDRLALIASDTLEIEQAEADDFVRALNAHFGGDGLRFEARVPRRWYVAVERTPDLLTHTLSAAAGRNLHDVLPQGRDAGTWHQLINEIQMLFHALPANEARVERGQPPINSVWPWGGGVRTAVHGHLYGAVWSDDTLTQALATHADAYTAPLPSNGELWLGSAQQIADASRHLVVIDDCARAVAYGDMAGWRDAVTKLEAAWMRPLVAAMRSGRLDGLTLAVPSAGASWQFELTPRSLYRFWSSRRSLGTYGRS